MQQTRAQISANVTERVGWQVVRREDSRVARRLYRKQVVDGVYRLDEGALLDDFFSCLRELGVVDGLGDVRGTAVQREIVPVVQYRLRYSRKTLVGIESIHALPALLRIAAHQAHAGLIAAQQVRPGVCQRGTTKRQGPRTSSR